MKRITADINGESRGQIFAFLVTALSISSGTFLIYVGRDAYGLSVILGELGLLAGVFLYNRVTQTRELRRKLRDLLSGKNDEDESD
jgi:hypothetical protein